MFLNLKMRPYKDLVKIHTPKSAALERENYFPK